MKIEINYKNQKYSFKSNGKISVIAIISYIKEKILKTQDEEEYYLFTEDKFFNNDDFITDKDKKELFLVSRSRITQSQEENNELKNKDIEDIIMEATGGDKPLQKRTNANFSRFSNRRADFLIDYMNRPFAFLSRYGLNSFHDEDDLSDDFRLDSDIESNINPFVARNVNIVNNEMNINNNVAENNQDSVNMLVEMGFQENRVRVALRIAQNDISRATELLLNSDDILDNIPERNNFRPPFSMPIMFQPNIRPASLDRNPQESLVFRRRNATVNIFSKICLI
jgi:hypothetical protein